MMAGQSEGRQKIATTAEMPVKTTKRWLGAPKLRAGVQLAVCAGACADTLSVFVCCDAWPHASHSLVEMSRSLSQARPAQAAPRGSKMAHDHLQQLSGARTSLDPPKELMVEFLVDPGRKDALQESTRLEISTRIRNDFLVEFLEEELSELSG